MTLRQITAVLPPEKSWGLWLSRQIVATVMATCGPSTSGVSVEQVDTVLRDGRRLRGEWVRAPRADRADAAIYFLHGSGYALCSPRTHRRLTAWLSRMTGLPVFCVDPRLALNAAAGRTLPPTLIQACGAEMLGADAHRLATDIRTAGGNCELQVWPDQVHVFQALPRLAPEGPRRCRMSRRSSQKR